jgi:hypothetical protein
MKALIRAIALCREMRNSAAMSSFAKREVMPGNLAGRALESFVRDAATACLHQTCTAKMGRDELSVVDGRLQVYRIDNLRIAGWLDHAAHHDRQHHGALRGHWRARCRADSPDLQNLILRIARQMPRRGKSR